MKPGLGPGAFAELELVVTREMCPHFGGVLKHPIVATWTIVHYMEVAGRKLLEPHLEPGEDGVGVHIRIDHRAGAGIGQRVCVRADFESLQRGRLTARVSARRGPVELAGGVFVQAILSTQRLAELIAAASRDPDPRPDAG